MSGFQKTVGYCLLALATIPIGAEIVATVLYFHQGGFGGGHGQWDQLIYFLGYPSIHLNPYLPRGGLFDYTFVTLLWLPMLLNIVLWIVPYCVWRIAKKTLINAGASDPV